MKADTVQASPHRIWDLWVSFLLNPDGFLHRASVCCALLYRRWQINKWGLKLRWVLAEMILTLNKILCCWFISVHQDGFRLDTDSGFRLVQDLLLCREAYWRVLTNAFLVSFHERHSGMARSQMQHMPYRQQYKQHFDCRFMWSQKSDIKSGYAVTSARQCRWHFRTGRRH